MNEFEKCPVCGEDSLIPGETVDVGFGVKYGPKAGPDHCEVCGYVEAGPDPTDPPIDHFIRCWKEHIDPWPKLPEMIKAPLSPEHQAWIDAHVDEHGGYGQCRKVCAKMVADFPNLRRVYGTYFCPIWGMRHHFWCIDAENHVVDPTDQQFPSKGTGIYLMTRWYGVEFDQMKGLS